MERTRTEWNVTLQRSDGEMVPYTFSAFWSPNFEGIDDTVGRSAAAQAWFEGGKTYEYAPVAVVKA